MSTERFTIEHRPSESRYVLVDRGEGGDEAAVIGEEEYLAVPVADGEAAERIFYHTRVSDEYGGQGLAAKLVRAAVEDSIQAGDTIVPVCPYVTAWFKKNSEFAEHSVKATPEHLQAISAK